VTTAEFPLVSIGFPVYNGELTMRRALDSLLAQDYPNLELVISDNGSSDGTAAICQEYAQKDGRVRYYHVDQNQGQMWNFSRVLEEARGEYFMWSAHDDVWKPEFVRLLQADLQAHPEAGVAMSGVDIVDESGRPVKIVRFTERGQSPNTFSAYQLLLRLMTLWGSTSKSHHLYWYGLFRRELLLRTFPYYLNTLFGDRMFVSTLALVTRFRYVDQGLYIRTRNSKNFVNRYPDENFARAARSNLTMLGIPFRFGSLLWRCELIPPERKWLVPLGVFGMLKIILRRMIVSVVSP
jgi:glycosyltransferase involved in cell wall biosynthesis